jgi:putative CocE/NonD family hydrolase
MPQRIHHSGDRMLVRCLALRALWFAILNALGAISTARAQAPGDTAAARALYVKYEYRIPMRDGVRLYTAVYVPRDTSARYPFLIHRTRYGVGSYGADRYAPLGTAESLRRDRYIFVNQDVRGSFMSEGAFVDMTPQIDRKTGPRDVDQSSDTYDTVDWLVKNVPHNNGKAGLWGISYDGFFAAAGTIDAHPALVAVSPQAPQADWFGGDDIHLHGAFVLDGIEYFASWGRSHPAPTPKPPGEMQFGTRDGYQFYLAGGSAGSIATANLRDSVPILEDVLRHGTYDAYWKARNILPHLTNIKPAVMTVSGWYDANNLYGALHVYQAIEKSSPQASNVLVIGPWSHGQWARGTGTSLGDVSFGSATSAFFRDSIQAPFYRALLEGGAAARRPESWVFETGSNRWRTFNTWPPKGTSSRALYLREHGGLSFEPPRTDRGFDEYRSDPAHPVPFIERQATDRTADYMIQDQRFASRRPDVLVYESEPLADDVTIAGPVRPSFWVSTSGTDADWVVKLIDVYPDDSPETAAPTGTGPLRPGDSMGGYQQLVRGDVLRGKFRNSLEKPEPLISDARTHIEFEMLDVLHTFRKGHRIMVQVQSSWFPLVDRNPGQFLDIYHAKPSDYRPTTQRVFHSAASASRIEVNVLGPEPKVIP